MATTDLLELVARKGSSKEAIARRVMDSPALLPRLFDGLEDERAAVRYGCNKALLILSERSPAMLYPYIGRWFDLLESGRTFLAWGAIRIIGNLAAVDRGKKIDAALGRYLAPLPGPALIPAANAISGAGKIAAAKPYLADRIARALLEVERARYRTVECRNVALGHAVDAFGMFFDSLERKRPVVEFLERQLRNRRNATRRKAEALLKRIGA